MHFIQSTCQVFAACQTRWFRPSAGELKPSSTDFSWTRAHWEYGSSIACHRPTRNAAQVLQIHILLRGCLLGSAEMVFCSAGALRSGCLETCRVAVISVDKTRRQDVDNSAHALIVPWLLVGKCWQVPPNCCSSVPPCTSIFLHPKSDTVHAGLVGCRSSPKDTDWGWEWWERLSQHNFNPFYAYESLSTWLSALVSDVRCLCLAAL